MIVITKVNTKQNNNIYNINENDFTVIEPDFRLYCSDIKRVLYTGIKTFLLFSQLNRDRSRAGIVVEVLKEIREGKFRPVMQFTTTDETNLFVTILDLVYNFYCRDDSYISKGYLYVRFSRGCTDQESQGDKENQENCFKIHHRGQRQDDNLLIPDLSETDLHSADKLWSDFIPEMEDLYVSRDFMYDAKRCISELNATAQSVIFDIYQNRNGIIDNEDISFSIHRFPRLESIQNYVEAYYNLARFCIENNEVFQQSQNAKDIISRILEFGIEKDNQCKIWLLSPFVLHAFRNIYERTLALSKDLFSGAFSDISEDFLSVIISNFIDTCLEDFKRWVYIGGKSCLITFGNNSDGLVNCECHTLSNIASINLSSLYEKIKLFLKQTSKKHINILILGFHLDTMYLFSELEDLEGLVSACTYAKDSEIEYRVVVNNPQNSIKESQLLNPENWFNNITHINLTNNCKSRIKVVHVDYEEVFLKNNLTECLKMGDLIFILDCPNLYYENFLQSVGNSWSPVYSRFKNTTYNMNYTWTKCGTHIGTKGIIHDIDRQLAALTNANTMVSGTYSPAVKEYLLNFLNSALTNWSITPIGEPISIYCYLSTLNARGVSHYDTSRLTHKEEHNSRSFYVINFSNICEDSVEMIDRQPANSEHESIYFSLWNLLENIAINLKETQFNFGKIEESAITIFDKIGIQTSWDKRMENFHITLYVSKSVKDSLNELGKSYIEPVEGDKGRCKLLKFLKDIFSIVLGLNSFMLSDNIKAAVGNIILDRASKIEHLLLYYRIFLGELNVTSIECNLIDTEDDTDNILRNNIIYNASDKMLYLKVMKRYGAFYLDSIERTDINSKIRREGRVPDTVIGNIIAACRESGYTESNLYNNLCGR